MRSRWRSLPARVRASCGCRPSIPCGDRGPDRAKPGDKVPQWARLQHELRGFGLGVEPVHVTGPTVASCRRRATCCARSRGTAWSWPRGTSPGTTRSRWSTPPSRRAYAERRHPPRVPLPGLLARGPAQSPPAAACWSAASRPHSPGRRPGSTSSRACAPSASSRRCSRAMRKPRLPTRRGRARAVGRSPARCGVRRGRGPGDDRRAVPTPGRRVMSRRLLVIGAHSADFVWRAGGAIAVATAGGRRCARACALLRRAGRVGGALEGAGPDGRAREGAPPRARPSARRRRSAPTSSASTSATIPLQVDRDALGLDRRPHPRVRSGRRADAYRPRSVQPGSRERVLRGRARPRAGRGSGRPERVRDRAAAGAAALRAPSAGALQLRPDDVRRHHAGRSSRRTRRWPR